MNTRTLFLWFALALALLNPASVSAKNTLIDATDEVVADVKAFLDTQGKNKVRVGQFIGKGPEAIASGTAPILREALRISLRRRKVEVVDEGAQFELTGRFQAIEDGQTGRLAVILSVVLDDLRGNERKFQGVANGKAEKYFFENVPDVANVLGISCFLAPGIKETDTILAIKKGVDFPECHFDGTRILAAKQGPFAVEIMSLQQGKGKPGSLQSLRPTDHKGRAFVPIRQNEAYSVRIHNAAKHPVAVDLRVAGMNMYYFSQARDPRSGGPKYRYLVIGSNQSVEVHGWFVEKNDSEPFMNGPGKNPLISKMLSNDAAELGTITALFFRAWDRKEERPADEPPDPRDHSLCGELIGRGQDLQNNPVEVDYAVGTFRGSVSVRYTK